LALRESAAMGSLLVLHLGIVAGLFLTFPYGKFAHVVYRYAALVRFAIEQRRAESTTSK
jgi:citrate/tricarballylate utilization protein